MATATTTGTGTGTEPGTERPTERPLAALRDSLASFAGAFDASLLSDASLELVVDDAVAISSMATTVKAKAARARSTRSSSSSGSHRSAAHELAAKSGTSVKDAKDELKTAEVMEKHRELDDAASSGRISPRQASLIAGVADANPSAVTSLVEAAQKRSSLAELRDLAAQARAAGDKDPEATRRRLRRARSLRSWSDAEGLFHLHFQDTPDRGAEVLAALGPLQDMFFEEARQSGHHESPEAYGADALVELARRALAETEPAAPHGAGSSPSPGSGPGPDPQAPEPTDRVADDGPDPEAPEPTTGEVPDGPVPDAEAPEAPVHDGPVPDAGSAPVPAPRPARRAPAKIIIRVDYETLLRGYPVGDEICEVAGVGPISPQAVAEWLLQPDSFMAAVVTKAKAVAGVVHFGRQPTAHQRTALEWLHSTCAVEGCGARAQLEIDHILDWSVTHRTKLEDLGPLCRPHHKKKTEEGWMLVDGIGSRAFVAPEDPRHPLFENGKAGKPRTYRPRGRTDV